MTLPLAHKRTTPLALAWLAGLALALVSLLGAVAIGPSPSSLSSLLHDAWSPASPSHFAARAILFDVRLPRALGSLLVGACLSLSGVLLQAATRNPIADPYLVGTSAGATLAAVLATPWIAAVAAGLGFDLASVLPWSQSLAALCGAMLAVSLTFAIARTGGPARPERLLLAGLVLTAFAGAATSFVLYRLSDVRLRAATQWLMGGVSVPSPWALAPGSLILACAMAFGIAHAPHLNALGLGSDAARGVGVDEGRLSRQSIWWSSALAAAAVSLAGIVGFVGLLVPHGLRAVLGRDHRALVPAAAFAGGALLCWMDALARVVVAPAELPVGILTALFGCPLLVGLLGVYRRKPHAVEEPTQPADLPQMTNQPSVAAALLGCRQLTARYRSRQGLALDRIDLGWPAGRLVALVGPNGSGKTTLLRCLAGIRAVQAGEVLDGGQPRPPRKRPDPRQIAYLPQEPLAEPGTLVGELLLLGRSAHVRGNLALRLSGRGSAADAQAMETALEQVDLAGTADQPIEHLSGGQRRRAFLGMVLAQQARVLLLDEPTASLDLPQADRLLGLLAQLARDQDLLVVAALHDLPMALRHADEIAVLGHGRLLARGAPRSDDVQVGLRAAFGADIDRLAR